MARRWSQLLIQWDLFVEALLPLALGALISKDKAVERDIKTFQVIEVSYFNIYPAPCILALEETAHG